MEARAAGLCSTRAPGWRTTGARAPGLCSTRAPGLRTTRAPGLRTTRAWAANRPGLVASSHSAEARLRADAGLGQPPRWLPKREDYRAHVREVFEASAATRLIGATLGRIEPGWVE